MTESYTRKIVTVSDQYPFSNGHAHTHTHTSNGWTKNNFKNNLKKSV